MGRRRFSVPDGSAKLTAWAPGYFVAGGDAYQAGDEVELAMAAIPVGDNPAYEWVSVDSPEDGVAAGCVNCHSGSGTDLASGGWPPVFMQ